jgi:hypothetical protein
VVIRRQVPATVRMPTPTAMGPVIPRLPASALTPRQARATARMPTPTAMAPVIPRIPACVVEKLRAPASAPPQGSAAPTQAAAPAARPVVFVTPRNIATVPAPVSPGVAFVQVQGKTAPVPIPASANPPKQRAFHVPASAANALTALVV